MHKIQRVGANFIHGVLVFYYHIRYRVNTQYGMESQAITMSDLQHRLHVGLPRSVLKVFYGRGVCSCTGTYTANSTSPNCCLFEVMCNDVLSKKNCCSLLLVRVRVLTCLRLLRILSPTFFPSEHPRLPDEDTGLGDGIFHGVFFICPLVWAQAGTRHQLPSTAAEQMKQRAPNARSKKKADQAIILFSFFGGGRGVIKYKCL